MLESFRREWDRRVDGVRALMTRGFEVGASTEQVPRGGELDGSVNITSAQKLERVDVGLVCTEYYSVQGTSSQGGISRETSSAVVHETWFPVPSTPDVHTVLLRIPEEAPFSYEGRLLSFRWEVAARGQRKKGIDARAVHDILVLP